MTLDLFRNENNFRAHRPKTAQVAVKRAWHETERAIVSQRNDPTGGKAHYLVSGTGQDAARKEFARDDAAVHDLNALAAIASTAEYPFISGQMVHDIEVLEAIACSAEDRRTVEISELG
ncbi:MAG: hypothetical protein F4X97_14290 [Boseongicola sp. SB0662_bin_57]|nr:hypothetical protein [Boseongicola sp. SB0662_bin_57]